MIPIHFRIVNLTIEVFVFPLSLRKIKIPAIYKSSGVKNFNSTTVYSPKKFLQLREREEFAFGVYYGILLVLVIYNLIFLCFMIIYICFFTHVLGGMEQANFKWISLSSPHGPNSPYWANISFAFWGFSLWGIQSQKFF